MGTKKNDEMRAKLLVKPDLKEAEKELSINPDNPELWYNYGMAVADNGDIPKSIEVFSEGISRHPFSEILYFGRGRKYMGITKYSHAISDFTMSVRLDPEVYSFWYYRAVANNLSGNYEKAIKDFESAMDQTEQWERYGLIDWIFTSYIEMGDIDKAKTFVQSMPGDLDAPQMHYGYKRRVQLYKGLVAPEEFIDLEDIKSKCVDQKDRVALEVVTLLFGLYIYYIYTDNQIKADETLLEILKNPYPGAFGYLKGKTAAKKRGLAV